MSFLLQVKKWKSAEVNTMERRVGYEVLVALVTLLVFSLTCVTASPSGPTKLQDHVKQFRGNLLANGLGRTPPMGYVCDLCSLSLCFFSSDNECFSPLVLRVSVSLFITHSTVPPSCRFVLWIVLARILGKHSFSFSLIP